MKDMMERAGIAVCRAYWNTKLKLMKLMQEEDGAEVMEVVIIIGIVVIIAGALFALLVGGGEKGEDGNYSGGIIGKIFGKIGEAINSIFGE